MSETGRLREAVRAVGFTVAVTAVFIAAVSALDLVTRDRTSRNEKLFERRAVMEAAGLSRNGDSAQVQRWYAEHVEEPPPAADGVRVFRVRDATGALSATVFEVRGKGLWGPIRAAVGLDRDLSRITGISFVEHQETPGLGARIEEPAFRQQFVGRSGPFATVAAAGVERIDGITGATITTRAVIQMLNETLADAPSRVRSALRKSEAP